MKPKANLEDAGFETTVVSLESGEIKGWNDNDWGDSVAVDKTVGDVSAADYDALLLPGGQMNPDILRMDDGAVALVKSFGAAGKPIAAICHAPWLLIEAGSGRWQDGDRLAFHPHRSDQCGRERRGSGSGDGRQSHHQPQSR